MCLAHCAITQDLEFRTLDSGYSGLYHVFNELFIRGAVQFFYRRNLGFCPDQGGEGGGGPHQKLGHQKYLAFQAILTILFFNDKFHLTNTLMN